MVKFKRPAEMLNDNYSEYVNNMSEWKEYIVRIYCGDKVVKNSKFMSYNKNHLLLEISMHYDLEAIGATNIVIEDVQ